MIDTIEQYVSASLYPEKIIIATMMGDKYGSTRTTTDCLSILPVDISDDELGIITLRHLLLSKTQEFSVDEIYNLRTRFKMLTKFKTEKQISKNSKLVVVVLSNEKLSFEPKNNMYSKGGSRFSEFQGMPTAIFNIKYPCTSCEIGVALQKAWTKATIS